jgi:hypothetical protein
LLIYAKAGDPLNHLSIGFSFKRLNGKKKAKLALTQALEIAPATQTKELTEYDFFEAVSPELPQSALARLVAIL